MDAAAAISGVRALCAGSTYVLSQSHSDIDSAVPRSRPEWRWQFCSPGRTTHPVASTTSAPAARGSASITSTGPTAAMTSPSTSTDPGSSCVPAPPVMGSTMPLRMSVATAATYAQAMARRHPLLVAIAPVADALGAAVVPMTRVRDGDIPLEWEGEVVGGLRLPGVHGTLERMVAAVETELDSPLHELSREDKQRAVQLLDDRGAFQLRKSV